MKRYISAAVIFAGVLAASGCAKEKQPAYSDSPVAVTFTSMTGIAEARGSITKVSGTSWENGDEIGVTMVVHGSSTLVDNESLNKMYATDGSGNFSALNAANTLYYPMDDSSVDFAAYFPYRQGTTSTFAVDVSNQTDQAALDLMWGGADTGFTKSGGETPSLQFFHMLTKLNLNIKAGAGITDANLASVSVKLLNMPFLTNFNILSGTLSGNYDLAKMDITPLPVFPAADGHIVSFEAILLPFTVETAGSVVFEFTIGNEAYNWTIPLDTAFEARTEYTCSITISRTGVTATGTIDPWITFGNDREGLSAE